MPKAKAGRSAKKRQEHDRRADEHREAILAAIPARPTPETEPTRTAGVSGSTTASPAETGGQRHMVDVDGSATLAPSDAAADASHRTDTAPDIQPGPDRSITASAIGSVDRSLDQVSVRDDIAPDDDPGFAPVPRVPAEPGAAGATSMDASQSPPRGRMTDRYTVWSRAASRPADVDPQPVTHRPEPRTEESVGDSAASPDVDVTAPSHRDTRSSVGEPTTDADGGAQPTTGLDLAMSRLRTATTATAASGPHEEMTIPDGLGSAEAALDEAVGQVIDPPESVEAAVSEATGVVGTAIAPDRAGAAGQSTDARPDHLDDGQPGAAGPLDDLADRPGAAGSLGQAHDVSTDDADATPSAGTDPVRRAGAAARRGRDHATETADRVGAQTSAATTDLEQTAKEAMGQVSETAKEAMGQVSETAKEAMGQVRTAGSDIVGSLTESVQATQDDVAATAGLVGERAQTAGKDVVAAVEDGLDQAGDRVRQVGGDITATTHTAAEEITGAVGRAIHDVRDQVAGVAQDLLTIGRDVAGEARTIAGGATADVRSGIVDAAGLIAETGRAATGAISGRASETAHTLTGSATDAAAGLASTVRSGFSGADASAADTIAEVAQTWNSHRFIVSAIAVGTLSGLNRWAVRRVTGADIALLGPSTIHPAILGTGLAALIASLYMTEE